MLKMLVCFVLIRNVILFFIFVVMVFDMMILNMFFVRWLVLMLILILIDGMFCLRKIVGEFGCLSDIFFR